jgi:hypothetical protein
MSQNHLSHLPSHWHQRRASLAGAVITGVAGLLLSEVQAEPASELLGAAKKSVRQLLGEGQPLEGRLFNEESSDSHSGGIGSTHAHRVRIGYFGGRSCYAFFMKKTGETFNPIEVSGLLYLCASHAEWRELEAGGGMVGYFYRADQPKGKGAGPTYLATLDETGGRLFVYAPQWRPDFDRELWITPDEAPVHREAERMLPKGGRPRPSGSKQSTLPDASLFGKSAPASDAKQSHAKGGSPDPKRSLIDPKQGIYLPKLDRVVPAEDPKAAGKQGKRKNGRPQRTPPPPSTSGK